MTANPFARLLAPIARRVLLLVARGVVKLVQDDPKLQELQAEFLKGEVRSGLERFQEYGFTSHPLPGAEAVAVFVGGDRSHGLVLAVDDRRYRITGLQEGEVCLYDDQGQTIKLLRNGVIEAETGTVKLTLDGDGNTARIETDPAGPFVELAAGGIDLTFSATTKIQLLPGGIYFTGAAYVFA